MSQLRRYLTQFKVVDMPEHKAYYRYAFDLVILSNMSAEEIIREIDIRCQQYVKDITGHRPDSNKILYSLVTTLYSTNYE